MKKINKSLLFSLCFLIVILIGYAYLSRNNNDVSYLTESVQRGDIVQSVIASGTVRSNQRVEVGAQVSGQIKKLYVQLGQKVRQGDLLAEIDSSKQIDALSTAQAKLAATQAQFNAKKIALEIAESRYQRLQRLHKQKSLSLDELEQAQNNYALAQATLEEIKASIKQAEVEVNIAQTNLGYTNIRSPIQGTVISIPVAEGQTVNANQTAPTIVQVADLSKMLIKAEISEGDIPRIQTGMAVEFNTLTDPDHNYQGQINHIDPALTTMSDNNYSESVADTNAVYYYANIIVENPDNKLRIGMTTQNRIMLAEAKNVLFVPTITLQKQGDDYIVQILNADNKVERRKVQIGLADDMNTEIRSGLKEGEKVISTQVNAGEKVGQATRAPRLF